MSRRPIVRNWFNGVFQKHTCRIERGSHQREMVAVIAACAHSTAAIGILLLLLATPAHGQSVDGACAIAQDERLRAADAAWDAGDHDTARRAYEAIVHGDTTRSSRSVYRLATLNAWAGELDAAIVLFRAYRSLEPGDAEGRIAHARTLAWAGSYDASVALYDSVAATGGPEAISARKGLALVSAWRSDLEQSELLWRAIVAERPDDAEAWTGLAQVLRWAGRPRDAAGAVQIALRCDPRYSDALEQRRLLDAELRAAVEPSFTSSGDSDGNRSMLASVTAALPNSVAGDWTITASHREAEQPGLSGSSRTVRVGGAWRVGTAVGVRAELGATGRQMERSPSGDSPPTTFVAAGGMRYRAGRASLGIGASRGAFDETAALIQSGIVVTSYDANGDLALGRGMSVSLGGGHTVLTGQTPNTRTAGSASLRWAATRWVALSATTRAFGYSESVREGYFAPERYTLTEGGVSIVHGRGLGWRVTGDAGVGIQTVTMGGEFASHGAQRASASLTYQFTPASHLWLSAMLANVATAASATAVDGRFVYRYGSLGLGARIGL